MLAGMPKVKDDAIQPPPWRGKPAVAPGSAEESASRFGDADPLPVNPTARLGLKTQKVSVCRPKTSH